MKKIPFLVPILAIQLFGFSQENDQPLKYTILSEVESPSWFGVALEPVSVTFSGSQVYFGAGINADAMNIQRKFNFTGFFTYNYGHISYDGNKISLASEDVDNKKSKAFQAVFGYTLMESTDTKTEVLTLAKSGNTEWITEVKAKVIETHAARIGFKSVDQFTNGEIGGSYFLMFHNQQNILLGWHRNKSIRSAYDVERFGKRYLYHESTVYADLMFSLPSKFPYIDARVYDETYTSDYTDENLDMDSQNLIRGEFKKLPVGIQAGWRTRSSSHKKERMIGGTKVEVGINSGYYSKISELVYVNLGISIGLFKSLK